MVMMVCISKFNQILSSSNMREFIFRNQNFPGVRTQKEVIKKRKTQLTNLASFFFTIV